MKKSGSSEAQHDKPSYLVFHSVISLSLSGGGRQRCPWGCIPPTVELRVPIASGLQEHEAVSPGPWVRSVQHRLDVLTPCFLLSLSPSHNLFPAGNCVQLLQEKLELPWESLPRWQRPCVALLRVIARKLVVMAPRGQGCTPKMPPFSRLST